MPNHVAKLQGLLRGPTSGYPQNDALVYAAAETEVAAERLELGSQARQLAVLAFRRAAEEGNPRGARAVGFCHLFGVGGPANSRDARSWFERAALLGDVRAAYWTGHCLYWYEQRFKKAYGWLLTARTYDPTGDAFFLSGLMHSKGHGCLKEPDAAYQLFRDAALLGQPLAMRALCELLAHGVGCARDPVAAHRWCEAAREARTAPRLGWATEIAALGRLRSSHVA